MITEKIYKTPLGDIHYWINILEEDAVNGLIEELVSQL